MKMDRHKKRGTSVCISRCFGVGWCIYMQAELFSHSVYGTLFLLHGSDILEGQDEGTLRASCKDT